ncbi:homing endonuclease associated repeat-containing protein [Streptomyces niveus]|uniref:homing endonuclease associated repeat-containing protein n=1 Tax=Streptomyces niveus TaxID=193462 RepID=UPI0036C7DCD2
MTGTRANADAPTRIRLSEREIGLTVTLSAVHVPVPMKAGPAVYTDQQLLRVLIHLAQGEDTLGRRTFEQRRRGTDPSASLYERRFGSWNRALELVGLAVIEQPQHLQNATTKWTQEHLIAAIRRCLAVTGSTTLAAYEAWRTDPVDLKVDVPPATTIRFRMGSWSRATELACG